MIAAPAHGTRARYVAPAHGTRARYVSRTYPCRCVLCRAANAEYHRGYRRGVRGVGVSLTAEQLDAYDGADGTIEDLEHRPGARGPAPSRTGCGARS